MDRGRRDAPPCRGIGLMTSARERVSLVTQSPHPAHGEMGTWHASGPFFPPLAAGGALFLSCKVFALSVAPVAATW